MDYCGRRGIPQPKGWISALIYRNYRGSNFDFESADQEAHLSLPWSFLAAARPTAFRPVSFGCDPVGLGGCGDGCGVFVSVGHVARGVNIVRVRCYCS